MERMKDESDAACCSDLGCVSCVILLAGIMAEALKLSRSNAVLKSSDEFQG